MSLDRDGHVPALPILASQDGEMVSFRLERATRSEPELSEAALALAAVLRPLVKEAPSLATRLLAHFGSLGVILTAAPARLLAVPGMTATAAEAIQAAYIAAALMLRERVIRETIGNRAALDAWLRLKLGALSRECAYALFLDRKSGLIRDELLAEGGPHHCPLTCRMVVAKVLACDASAVILVHNHPSGDPTPSPADIELTRAIATTLAGLDVALHDHVIVGRERTVSLRQERLI